MTKRISTGTSGGVFVFAVLSAFMCMPIFAQAQAVNLIQNPSLETKAADGRPANWSAIYWGSPIPTFTYPVTGHSGNAAQISLSAASNGDARWQPAVVNVTGGQTYTYSEWYKSNVATEIDVAFTNASGAVSYGWVADVASSNNAWVQITRTITIPSGVTKISVFHIIDRAGTLAIDDVSLSTGATPPPPPPNVPTLTFSANPTTIQSGQSSTLTWSTTNVTSCTASGAWSGTKATSGSQVVSPTATSTYTLSCTGAGSTVSQNVIVTVSAPPPPPPSGGFTEGMVSLTFDDSWRTQYQNALPKLQTAGFKATFFLTSQPIQEGWDGFMTTTQAKDLAAKGHEIAGHTVTHADLSTLSQTQVNTEIKNSKSYLQTLTGQTVVSLAYPYGAHNTTVANLVKQAGYTSARGVEYDVLNTATTNKYVLKSQCIETGDSIASIKALIDSAKTNRQWYILCFHEIKTNGDQWSTTPARLQEIIDYIKSTGIKVVTVKQGRALMAN